MFCDAHRALKMFESHKELTIPEVRAHLYRDYGRRMTETKVKAVVSCLIIMNCVEKTDMEQMDIMEENHTIFKLKTKQK